MTEEGDTDIDLWRRDDDERRKRVGHLFEPYANIILIRVEYSETQCKHRLIRVEYAQT